MYSLKPKEQRKRREKKKQKAKSLQKEGTVNFARIRSRRKRGLHTHTEDDLRELRMQKQGKHVEKSKCSRMKNKIAGFPKNQNKTTGHLKHIE